MSDEQIPASPLPGLSLDEIFPKEEDFIHHWSDVHGVGHVSRVICHAFDLVQAHGPDEYRAPVWAAAFLHDLARRTDGVCDQHGRWAVEDCWDLHVERFRRAGVGPEWDERIKAAVVNHCDPANLAKEDPAWRLAAFLKDADALDRYRLNGEAPDPRRLRFEHDDEVYFRAEKLEYLTDGCESGIEVWQARQEMGRQEKCAQGELEGLPALPHITAIQPDIAKVPDGGKESRR